MEHGGRTDIRTVYRTEEFMQFFSGLSDKVRLKMEWTINIVITERVIPTKYVKHLTGTDLYEMRVSVGTNEYRTVLFSIDHDNIIEATKVILLNGFLKKSTKDYDKEVAKAQRILKRLELL